MINYGLIFIFVCGFMGSLALSFLGLCMAVNKPETRAEQLVAMASGGVACAVGFAIGIISIVEKL